MRPQIREDDVSQHLDILGRLRRLEEVQARTRIFDIETATSVIDLGAIEGDNITGVRISIAGLVTISPAANTVMRLRINGSPANVSVSRVNHRSYFDGTNSLDDIQGAASFSAPGFAVAQTDWAVENCYVWADGMMFTKRLVATNLKRAFIGIYANEDASTNGNRILSGRQHGVWHDISTEITSLSLALDAGTFTGRISAEIAP
jgi:hypothetical protein